MDSLLPPTLPFYSLTMLSTISTVFFTILLFTGIYCENTEEEGPLISPEVQRQLELEAAPNPFLNPRVHVTFPGAGNVDLAGRLGLPWYTNDEGLAGKIYEQVPHSEWPGTYRRLFEALPPGFIWNGLGR
ncbi:unnamed protein product, partial [Mesorhabditis spiculigera]